jgi:hypothetical protein
LAQTKALNLNISEAGLGKQHLKRKAETDMAEAAGEELAALVRQVLPSRRCRWIVQVVDRHEEARADFIHNRIWIRRDWRSTVYEAGLHDVPELRSVKRYFPLSLKSVTPQVLRRMGSRVFTDLWEVRAIRKGNGRLTSLAGHVARTTEGQGTTFHKEPRQAELAAMKMMRRERARRGIAARARAKRNVDHQIVFRERARLREYDRHFCVSIDTYDPWLPKAMVDAYRYFEGGVPLIVIENEIAALVPDLDDR